MENLYSINEKKINDLKKIFLNYTHFPERYRIKAIKNYSGVKNIKYYEVLILGLNDSSRKIRNLILSILEEKGKTFADFVLPSLTSYSRLRRNSIARLLGRWNSEFKRKKPYQILKQINIQTRSDCINEYINQIVTESDSNKIFHAAISLELIGDFRGISILRRTTSITTVLNSQFKRHLLKHDDYSVFVVILRFCQNPNDQRLKEIILKYYIQDLLRIASDYEFTDVFIEIFNDLGFLGKIIYEAHSKSLNQKIMKTLNYSVGSLAYKTMICVLSAQYPESFQELEKIRSQISDLEIIDKLNEISKSLLNNFRVKLNSGLALFL